jgi:hypothetical protein
MRNTNESWLKKAEGKRTFELFNENTGTHLEEILNEFYAS